MNATIRTVFPWGFRASDIEDGREFDITHEQITVLAREKRFKHSGGVNRALPYGGAFAILDGPHPPIAHGVPVLLTYENRRLVRDADGNAVDITANARAIRAIPIVSWFANTHDIMVRVFSDSGDDRRTFCSLRLIDAAEVASAGFTVRCVSYTNRRYL